jgi:hypothetical protein
MSKVGGVILNAAKTLLEILRCAEDDRFSMTGRTTMWRGDRRYSRGRYKSVRSSSGFAFTGVFRYIS